MENKFCSACKVELPLSKFSINKKKKDGRNGKCKKCHAIYVRTHYLKNKEHYHAAVKRRQNKIKKFIHDYKEKHICIVCGEERWWILEFHHRNPKEKEIAVALIHLKGWGVKRIINELNKCDILCANCHRDLHYKERIAGNAGANEVS